MANELSKKEVSGVISPQTGTVEDTYEIPDKPGYDEMICKLQPSDPAHADLFNTILGRIISNVAFLKRNSVSHEELGIPEGVSPSVENQVPAIPESPVKRENLADGDNMGTILAKVRKWLGDLKSVAFSGSYKDLSDKPSIPTVPGAIKNPHPLSVNGKSYDGEVAVEVGTIGIAYGGTGATTAAAARTALGLGAASTQGIANNLTTTAAGYALDARQGKVLQDEVNQINSNLPNIVIVEGDTPSSVTGTVIINISYPQGFNSSAQMIGARIGNYVYLPYAANSCVNIMLSKESINVAFLPKTPEYLLNQVIYITLFQFK